MENEISIKKDLNYPLNLWGLSIAIGSLLTFISFGIDGFFTSSEDFVIILLAVFFISYLFSTPVLAISWFLYWLLGKIITNLTLLKGIIISISSIGVLVTFYLFLDEVIFNLQSLIYIVAIFVSGGILNLKEKRRKKLVTVFVE